MRRSTGRTQVQMSQIGVEMVLASTQLSAERLAAEAAATGFRPDILEKVIHLLGLLDGFTHHPYLKNRIVLKGGTALNLFVFDLPRLSVDIDLNYIGTPDRSIMLAERPKIEQAIAAVCSRQGLTLQRFPNDHAGGKCRLKYGSVLGGMGNLEVDLNFMYRIPLWPIQSRDSIAVGSYSVSGIPVLDEHELAAGKLAALFSRRSSRDLFDVHQLFNLDVLDAERLRIAFIVYGAMNPKDWRAVESNTIGFDAHELRDMLLPVLRTGHLTNMEDPDIWVGRMTEETRAALSAVLPFTDAERDFLDCLLDHGRIEPSLLSDDPELADRILHHPALLWKAQNVRIHKTPGA